MPVFCDVTLHHWRGWGGSLHWKKDTAFILKAQVDHDLELKNECNIFLQNTRNHSPSDEVSIPAKPES
jgi:hypothetical protein